MASVAVLTLLVGAETRAPGTGSVFVESVVETDASALTAKDGKPTESVWSEESWPLEVDFDAIDSDADDDVVSEVLAPVAEPLDLRLLPLAEVAPRTLECAADSSRYALEAGLPRGPPRRA